MSKIMIFLLSFTEEIQDNYQNTQQLCEIAIAEATQQKGRSGSILDCISDIWDCARCRCWEWREAAVVAA